MLFHSNLRYIKQKAQALINENLKERFGSNNYDPTLNPDLIDIQSSYIRMVLSSLLCWRREEEGDGDDDVVQDNDDYDARFDSSCLLSTFNVKTKTIVCGTGGFIIPRIDIDEDTTIQIVRVHTHPLYRRRGIATKIVQKLEDVATNQQQQQRKRYNKVILETNDDWYDAIEFYQNLGYKEDYHNGEIFFFKLLR